MKKALKILFLLAIGSEALPSELDNLIQTSNEIVTQIDTGIKLVGAATEFSHHGDGLSSGNLSGTAHITLEHLEAYNSALLGMSTYKPYGDLKSVLENKAADELDLMDSAIDTFTEAVVEMVQVVEVAEISEAASSPQEEAAVQEFVVENQQVLAISQDTVSEYNESLDDIETHANNASAYIAVANSESAVSFLEQGIENANTTAEQTNIFYDANAQWVAMGYNTTRNLTAVYLNGSDGIGLDLYISEADILTMGSDSEFYLTGPTAQGYNCFIQQTDCEL